MYKLSFHNFKNIAALFLAAMFFSCGNELKEIQDFLAEKNLPIGTVDDVRLIHTDSGKVMTKLIASKMNDFANRTDHPFTEFPQGLAVTTYDKNGDSVTMKANYAIIFSKTNISEAKGRVTIQNHAEKSILKTEQLFWDANVHYIYTEKEFTLITKTDTITGKGFEANEDLSKVTMKSVSGIIYVNEE
jgi:LPS export ABC transporter protein LptC